MRQEDDYSDDRDPKGSEEGKLSWTIVLLNLKWIKTQIYTRYL